VLQELAPDVAPRFRTVDQVFALSVADRRFNLYVLGAFASAALLLAVLGIYGVLAYVVAQRMQEFGVRIALGATRRNIWGLVLRRASALVLAGVTIGTAASWGLTRLMSSLLFGVTATDPVTYAVVVAAVRCRLSARRASIRSLPFARSSARPYRAGVALRRGASRALDWDGSPGS
jgi:ABC-type antimicrobial peptide transport system permease subunit